MLDGELPVYFMFHAEHIYRLPQKNLPVQMLVNLL